MVHWICWGATGNRFWRLPFLIACVPDRTLSGLLLPHPKAQFSSRLELLPPVPAGDGCRRTGRSPEFSATRLWLRLTAESPGLQFPPESAALPQSCRCSAASTVRPCPIPPVCTARIPGGSFFARITPMRFRKPNDSIPQIPSRCNLSATSAVWNCSQMVPGYFVQAYKNEKVLYQPRTKPRFRCLPIEGTFTKPITPTEGGS